MHRRQTAVKIKTKPNQTNSQKANQKPPPKQNKQKKWGMTGHQNYFAKMRVKNLSASSTSNSK